MTGKKNSIQKRRATIHEAGTAGEDEMEEKKHMSQEEEDIFINEMLPKMDIIEKKSTDRSLNPQKLNSLQTKAWEEILASFNEKTKVYFQ